ncbi:putative HMP/thiamine import ATP-binding protein YkoD [Lentilactobacillus parabuchneri]|jgi:energy-coupling factor transport system ATP-binding protein|uniref:ATP-binding cassette domain-containing protein n=2 Tax=Lentilactobacillus parabuchneri TaxID=152331 RepID=A0A1X1FGU3_9LACO|nr:ABC transporter ATP-binding protein [Lentilactobacillus parabuchneri]APR06840.1 Putative HMP/thiamine import ATP-binding protein YkoD [Lentilactobacillus parabuchneri]KRM46925.1 phosphonate-transporting ATPase [Lentilactobacillus parabuchneri DSM 5707 = NBRC 107865]KRN78163.1 phosphonate-transporting ATPase [Lentilactobacillus parabuchneri]MBW0222546.1 ATP-binding cassette domain-containing protein [Lentilactobacillus parabuchneri]MBW0245866.1 ATP-binding cassette domain-containing protein 
MQELIQTHHLTFTYPDSPQPALADINLTIFRGQFVVIAGATGSGKTTLINHFKKELLPNGTRSGQILINQRPLDSLDKLTSAKTVGYVPQDPAVQPIMDTVIDELAFSLENIACPSEEIERRIAELANYLGLDQLLHNTIGSLSGGQLQLVNLASVLILRPDIILLDEPTAQLDPLSTQHFFDVLERIHHELGMTIVMTEHNLSTALALADTMVLIQDRQLSFVGDPATGIPKMAADAKLQYFVPDVPKLFLNLKLTDQKLPISVADGQTAILKQRLEFQSAIQDMHRAAAKPVILSAKDISFSFDHANNVVDRLALDLHKGDWLSIVGKNGSGKTTLLTMLAGLRVPQHGKIKFDRQIVWRLPTGDRLSKISFLSQTPALQFGAETVLEELQNQADQLPQTVSNEAIEAMIARLHLNSVKSHSPFDLSAGQQQLLGLAIALLAKPQLLILDEPTKGLDPYTKQLLGKWLLEVNQSGTTILMASHDMAFCAAYTKHCAFMFDGHLNTILPTREFFSDNFFFTTPINRLLRSQVPEAILVDDVTLKSEGTSGDVS